MNKTFKRLLCAAVAAAMSATAAIPVFAGTGTSAGAADGGVIGRVYADFEKFDVGQKFTSDPERGVISIEAASDLTYEIVNDNGSKAMKITRAADGQHNFGIKILPIAGTLDDADYWVIKYDLKNGDTYPFYRYDNGAVFGNEFPYINQQLQFRNDGESIIFAGTRTTFTTYAWHEFMFIGNPKTGNVRLVLDGKDLGETKCDRIGSVGDFFGVQLFDSNSGRPYDHVMYVDDMEIYGIKNVAHKSTAALTADSENAKVYIDFDYPVTDFDASKVTVNGGSIVGVTEENGRYVVSLAGLAKGKTYTVRVAGVTDEFGAEVDAAAVEIAGTNETVADGVYGKVSANFEKFEVGQKFTSDPERNVISIEYASDLTYEIVNDNGSKAMKITREKGGSSKAGIKLIQDAETSLADADYWVMKYDFKNGDSASNEFGYVTHMCQFRNNAESISWPDDNHKIAYTAHEWHEYIFIGNKATGNVRLILDGRDCGEQKGDRMESADNFFGIQIYDLYSSNSNECVMYVDNMEIYGVNAAERQVTAELSADENENKIYAKFSALTADFDASKVTIDGGASISGAEYDAANGRWVISYENYKPGTVYTVSVAAVTDIMGAKTEPLSIEFTAPRIKMPKTYLKTTNGFLGYDDFEGYSGTGAFETKAQTPATITRNSDGVNIKNIWSNSTGGSDTVECSLADDGTGNHAYKITATAGAQKNHISDIFQPNESDINKTWTADCEGKYYVYELKFRGGSDTEEPIGVQIFEMLNGAVTLDYTKGSVEFVGGKTYSNALEVKKWNTLQYIVDCSRDTAKEYFLINGKLLGAFDVPAEKLSIRNGNPRMGSAYLSGTEGASVYLDDIAIYVIDPMQISAVAPTDDGVTVTVRSSYENGTDDQVPAKVYVAVYDADGALVGAAKAADSVDYGINDYTADISVADGCTVKAFIWNASFGPLCAAR